MKGEVLEIENRSRTQLLKLPGTIGVGNTCTVSVVPSFLPVVLQI